MQTADMRLLFDYSAWASRKILQACHAISQDDFTAAAAPDPGHGSLRATLVHTLDADYGWRMLLQHGESTPLLDEADFPTPADLAARWEEEIAAWDSYLNSLTDADLNGVIRSASDEEDPPQRILWHYLVHVVNHATQHRSEAAAMLTGCGRSPGELDLLVFLREQP